MKQRCRTHGVLRGIRYSLGVWFLYPVLNSRHRARLIEYENSDKGGVETLARSNPWNEEARYTGTITDMLEVPDISGDVLERLQAWKQRGTREGFRRGAMLEALHIVRCDMPEDFFGPYMPVERSDDDSPVDQPA
jgi:hypothetical protein